MSGDKDFDDQMAEDENLIDDGEFDESGLDDDGFADDGFAEDEDWDGYDDEDGADGATAADGDKKKKRSRFNIMVIGGGVAVAVLFMVIKMMAGGPAPAPAPGAPQQQQAAAIAEEQRRKLVSASLHDSPPTTQRDVIYGLSREDTQAQNRQAEAEMSGGLLNDPGEVRRIEQYRAQLEDELVAHNAPVAPADDLPAARPQVVDQEPPMPVPMGAGNAAAPVDSVLTPLPDTPRAPVLTAGNDLFDDGDDGYAASPIRPSNDNGSAAANGSAMGLPRAQDVARAADATPLSPFDDDDALSVPANPFADDAPVAVQAVPERATAAATVPAESVAALESRLAAMAQEMEKMRADSTSRIKDLESTVKQLERALEARATAAPARSSTASASPPRTTTAARPAATAPAPRWVLKSASPGAAMVSRSGESEMRSVAVGDNLPGVGRVTQIYQSSTGWVVQGTQGRIMQ